MENSKKVWFVTGASKGLGLSLVKKLLSEGYKVAATSRSAESLTKAVGAGNADFLPLPGQRNICQYSLYHQKQSRTNMAGCPIQQISISQ
ncbi:SDR family NAD(P)-dependent oxidoreductase [Xanthocytophaga agilis]|uniref:SDR family NAD(P)-dependent oxidoreductase n=1 Tax=Xanthocytophaga agilis TaxID=3048010 RepID=UPI0028D13BD5|nr:SDR family NAD(P)-dependent oxidoreductase [Xanthocytophaga agilis]